MFCYLGILSYLILKKFLALFCFTQIFQIIFYTSSFRKNSIYRILSLQDLKLLQLTFGACSIISPSLEALGLDFEVDEAFDSGSDDKGHSVGAGSILAMGVCCVGK